MFTLIQRKNGIMTSMETVSDSRETANKMLEIEVTKDCKTLADLSTESLLTLKDGQEFVIKDVATGTSVLDSWKQYKKLSETVSPAGWLSEEVKAPKTELVAEYAIVEIDVGVVSDFIADLDDKEEAEEDDNESKAGLHHIRAQYATESPKCIDFRSAVVIGNFIRFTLLEEDNEELLNWCFMKSEESKGTRADLLNLIGYITKWVKDDMTTAAKYFKMSAALGYPLAMVNLAQSDVPDRKEWEAVVAKTGYNFYVTE